MACKNEQLMMYGIAPLEERDVVYIDVYTDIDDCKKIKTKDFINSTGDVPVFERADKPDNAFECMRSGCINSGTLYSATANQEFTYKLDADATKFVAGVISLYTKPSTDSETLKVIVSSEANFTNADVYESAFTTSVSEDGYIPVFIDLSQVPTSQEGTGWEPSQRGTYIKVVVEKVGTGISSIMISDSMYNFETVEHIEISCLSEVTNDLTFELKEANCVSNGYDTTANTTSEITIAGKKLTENYPSLNPARFKGDTTNGFDMVTSNLDVTDYNGKGGIIIPNYSDDECGFVGVQFVDKCDSFILKRLTTNIEMEVDDEHFVVIKEADGTAVILVNDMYIGKKLVVSYPKKAEVREFVQDYSRLGEKRARITYDKKFNGKKTRIIANNFLISSFQNGVLGNDADFSFTGQAQKDKDGMKMHEYEYVD